MSKRKGSAVATVILIFLVLAFTMVVAGLKVKIDMPDQTEAGDYRFRFAEDLEEAYGDNFNLDGDETAFVPKSDTENWEPSWGMKDVYIRDHRVFFEMYESCWHEVRHWELGQAEDLSTDEDHERIENTPFFLKHRWVCDKALLTGIVGFP